MLGLGELTHVNNGEINMIDVSAKVNSLRTAYAHGEIHMDRYTIKLIKEDKMKKGSVLTVAEIAGIQAAKNTSSLIPLSHNIPLSKIEVKASLKEDFVKVETMSRCIGQTGVEMEALTAASIALLTIYDMCKAVDKSMVISNITLLNKTKDRID
ncbi:MAG: cyclic pyranopterin monophosphate synthase MoaC [Bacteroidales bacterium]